MKRTYRQLVIAAVVGLISDVWPIPGFFMAAVFYREGIHSSHPAAYLALVFILNFLLFAGVPYVALAKLRKPPKSSNPEPQGPAPGIIYTQSELDEFDRRSSRPR